MALPSSGQLSLGDIAGELGVALSNVSLRNMSSTAGKSTPDSMAEFYGYSAYTPITVDWSYGAGTCTGDSFSISVNSTQIISISAAGSGTFTVNDNDFIEVTTISGFKVGCEGAFATINAYLEGDYDDGSSDTQYGTSAIANASFTVPNGASGVNYSIEITGGIGLLEL
jgi:hypothetical protein